MLQINIEIGRLNIKHSLENTALCKNKPLFE